MNFSHVLSFLAKLNKNNDRTWFEKNKDSYFEAKEYFETFIAKTLDELIKFNPDLKGLDPKKLPFRIYRDVRFSKDKRPYKTNMGAGISPGGKLIQEPGYYIHIEPGKSFVAGGIYMPDSSNLSKIRQEIDYNGEKFEKIFKDKTFKKWFKQLDDFDKLKSVPKGYDKEHPRIEYLKHKSYIVSREFTDAQVKNKNFIKNVIETCKAIKPLNNFLKEAIA